MKDLTGNEYREAVERRVKGRVIERIEDRFSDGLLIWLDNGEFLKFTSAVKYCPGCDEAVTDSDVDYVWCEKGNK
jgi:hypothetical protein